MLRRPRLAHPFTVMREAGLVRLVAGEDLRYTLRGDGLHTWLPDLVERLDGQRSLSELLDSVPAERRAQAEDALQRLASERAVVEGPVESAHAPAAFVLAPTGQSELLGLEPDDRPGPKLHVLCQDRLDYREALDFDQERRGGQEPWLWVTIGPAQRGLVSPPFLPNAGPCLGCLLHRFQRRSPAPELYRALLEHTEQGGVLRPATWPAAGLEVLAGLVRWKASQLAQPQPAAALYRLHVLELASFEVRTARVYVEPECACATR